MARTSSFSPASCSQGEVYLSIPIRLKNDLKNSKLSKTRRQVRSIKLSKIASNPFRTLSIVTLSKICSKVLPGTSPDQFTQPRPA